MGKRFQIDAAGVDGVLESELPPLGSLKLFQNGEQLSGKKGRFQVLMSDGSTADAILKGSYSPELEIGAAKYAAATPLPPWLLVVAMLPLALGLIGGCLGWVFGSLAATLNVAVARSELATPLKLAIMFGVTGVLFVALIVIAGVLQLAIGPTP